jgi:uncharacterized protein YxjI
MVGRRRQERREERRDERAAFGVGGSAKRYQMREKLLSIGDDSWIEDESGQKVFKVNGKALRVRKTLVFEDPDGNELCKIQERKLRVRDSMEIEGPDGERLAMVKKAMVTPLRERWVAEMGDGTELRVQGNIVDHEYELEHEGAKVAQVSKRWFRVRDTYGIEVAPGQQDILVLAVAVAVDAMADRRD